LLDNVAGKSSGLSHDGLDWRWDILCQLLHQVRTLDSLSLSMAQEVLLHNGQWGISHAKPHDEAGEFIIQDAEDEERFLVARDGDNLTTPFQCDACHFMNINGREPLDGLASDVRLLKGIRRVNLDAFWVREPEHGEDRIG
jgi:hypothetical protein